LSDGTIILSAPDRAHLHHRTPPRQHVSALNQDTGELNIPPHPVWRETNRSLMMPRRKQTREQHRRDRINQERRERTELIAEEERQRQAWLAANYEPPP
jgi:hypothetical protein